MSKLSKKFWIVSLSIAAHVGVFTVAFVTNMWRMDRLDPGRQTLSLAVLQEPPAPSGGPKAGEKPKDPVSPRKQLARDPVQPVVHTDEPAKPVDDTDGGGGGDKQGPGSNPDGDPGDTGSCVGPACGPPATQPQPQVTLPEPPKPPVVTFVPPNVLKLNRISGETAIVPPDVVKTQMARDDHKRVVGSFKLCVTAAGDVSSVVIAGSTKYPEYDRKLMAAMRDWKYRPLLIDGRPAPVCSAVSFVFTME